MMDNRPEMAEEGRPNGGAVARMQVDLPRAIAATALLGGLLALLFFVLLPRAGADGSVASARMVALVRDTAGISSVDLRSHDDPPTLAVAVDPTIVPLDDRVALLSSALSAHPGPLYTRELELRYPEGVR